MSVCLSVLTPRANAQELTRERTYWRELDPFPVFDLLFGATGLNLKIVDIPMGHRERTCEATNISRIANGSLVQRKSNRGAE